MLLASAMAPAQTASGSGRPDPLNPRAEVPALRHDSALATYRGLGEDKSLGWKDANDATHRIGGWRAYAREAALPASVPTPAKPDGSAR